MNLIHQALYVNVESALDDLRVLTGTVSKIDADNVQEHEYGVLEFHSRW